MHVLDCPYDGVTMLNIKGYTMKLIEIPGMAGDCGFSGAPVFNSDCQFVGVFHAVFNLATGYAVGLESANAFSRHTTL